jgi:hypothetical protein
LERKWTHKKSGFNQQLKLKITMKTHLFALVILGSLCWNASAQTADQWVSQGRSYLAAQDMVDANNAFGQALAASPTNENANVFYAATRLLQLPGEAAGSNFLTRIGIPLSGRNIYNWQAEPPLDTNGIVIAPAGVDANEFTAQLRDNLLPEIAGAIANLAAVTDTNFMVNLTSEETSVTAVTVDYGDLKLIQAGLYVAEHVIYLLNAQNLDVQLTALRSLATNPNTTVQSVLSAYPQLLTFATTNDLQLARIAFSNAVNAYMTASAIIRGRPADQVRLFNFDPQMSVSEGDFRLTLQDLNNSLELGPQIPWADPNLMVDMSPQFEGKTAWRSLLPEFSGDGILLGSFPDLTFGGLVYGLDQENFEDALARNFTDINLLPVGGGPIWQTDGLKLPFNTLRNHRYVLQMSTDLINWSLLNYFTATSSITTLLDPQAGSSSKGFYRLRDDSGGLVFVGTVIDQSTGLPIAGAFIQSWFDFSTTTTDANGNFYLATTLPPGKTTGDSMTVSAPGYVTSSSGFSNYGIATGLVIYLAPL